MSTVTMPGFDDTGVRQYVADLPADMLSVDPRYQRALIASRVSHLVRGIDDTLLGVLTISHRRDGRRIIVDGQHRHAALLKLDRGPELVRCHVYEGLSVEGEAALFRGLNDTRKISGADHFRAGLLARDPECVAIANTASAYGFAVETGHRDNNVACISTLVSLWRRPGGPEAVGQALGVIRAAWDGDADSTEKSIVFGVTEFFRRHPGSDAARLARRLSKRGAMQVAQMAQMCHQTGQARTVREGGYFAIVGIWNRGLSAERRVVA